ncbi:MAG TPA: A24 family peptidase [Acidimicrobiales bacterium]|nr:A24 family peptidase [Acidimicrobiales bacterium]
MDAAVLVGAALLGVLVSPYLLRLVVRVPAMATVGYVSEEEATITPRFRERAVRVATPLLFALAAWRFEADAVLVPFLVLFAVLVVVSVIDLEHYRIPDRITFPALAVSLGLITFVTLIKDADTVHVRNALIGAVAYFVLLLVPHLVYPRGMGFGDVKLALLMGLFLGWLYADPFQGIVLIMWALVVGSGLGVAVGVFFALVRGRRAEFPFGPALALGCAIAVLFSDSFVG